MTGWVEQDVVGQAHGRSVAHFFRDRPLLWLGAHEAGKNPTDMQLSAAELYRFGPKAPMMLTLPTNGDPLKNKNSIGDFAAGEALKSWGVPFPARK